jgi:hypothetical protein
MANNLYFPAIKEFNTFSLNDQWTFFPIVADRNDYYGSIDGLPRKSTLGNLVSFLEDNLNVTASGSFIIQEEGSVVGSAFTTINFIGDSVTAVDATGGIANITITGSSDTHMMNTNLTADAARSHTVGGFNWFLKNGADSILDYTVTDHVVQLGTTANHVSINNAGNQTTVTTGGATSILITASRITAYDNLFLDEVSLTFQNPENNTIAFAPRAAGVTNSSYTLPVSSSVGYLYNNASSEMSWNIPSLMSDLADVDARFYQTIGDLYTQTFTTWVGNEPSVASSAAWLLDFNASTYVMTYDPLNDVWRPVLGFELATLFSVDLNTNIYTDNGQLDSARTVDTDGNLLQFYDLGSPTSSAGMIRLHNHRFRASGNDIQIGYYAAAAGQALDGSVKFFPKSSSNNGNPDASLTKQTGATGAFVMQNIDNGELWLQNAAAGAINKIILRNDGEVEFNEYGESTFTGTPTTSPAFTTDGTIIEVNYIKPIYIACSDERSDLTTGNAKVTFRVAAAFTVTGVKASVSTAPVGSTIIVDINKEGTSILSTKLSIDASEKTSTTAAVPPVISDSALAADAEITVDIDQIGSSTAGAGLKIVLLGYYKL